MQPAKFLSLLTLSGQVLIKSTPGHASACVVVPFNSNVSGCGVTTPDPSIVWSEDFESGDISEWEPPPGAQEGYGSIIESAAEIIHPNDGCATHQ